MHVTVAVVQTIKNEILVNCVWKVAEEEGKPEIELSQTEKTYKVNSEVCHDICKT
jgi:hypothetical protein